MCISLNSLNNLNFNKIFSSGYFLSRNIFEIIFQEKKIGEKSKKEEENKKMEKKNLFSKFFDM